MFGATGFSGAAQAGTLVDATGKQVTVTANQRIVAVGVTLPPHDAVDTEASLDELELLIDTAGADVVERVVQRRRAPDPATYVGKGKAAELRDSIAQIEAGV